jgi:hypothetical protein
MSDVAGSIVVTRRSLSTADRGLLSGIAIILAIVALWFWQLPADRIDVTTRLGLVVVLSLLALAFGGGAVYDVIRGRQRLLEADRDGIWVKGMPRLAWSEVADIRTEEIVSFNALRNASGTSLEVGGFEIELGKGSVIPLQEAVNAGQAPIRHRLGIVPRDPALMPDGGVVGGMNAWAERHSAEAAEQIGREAIELAPFGIYATEMDAIFEEVVEGIRRFHEVGALSDLEGISRPPGA